MFGNAPVYFKILSTKFGNFGKRREYLYNKNNLKTNQREMSRKLLKYLNQFQFFI